MQTPLKTVKGRLSLAQKALVFVEPNICFSMKKEFTSLEK